MLSEKHLQLFGRRWQCCSRLSRAGPSTHIFDLLMLELVQ